ncbi:MAG: response regulator [Microcystaceae cyanobacterium]
MQGTLHEIDMGSILQLIALSQQTGELFVESDSPASPCFADNPWSSWYVFFINGQIAYTTHPHIPRLSRLQDYLGHYDIFTLPNESLITSINDPEYDYLWLLLDKKIITIEQARTIMEKMVQETLFDLFNLYYGSFHFKKGIGLTPQLINIAIAPLIPQIMQQVQQWKQFYPHIRSSEQCLTIKNPTALQATLSPKIYQSLVHWADGKTSLRQLSRYLNRNLFTLAKGIYPYIERGWLYLTPYTLLSNSYTENLVVSSLDCVLKIICIDDDPTVGQKIKTMLVNPNHNLICFTHPFEALSQVFELQPHIILCDVTMPNLNGYEFCRMLRQSRIFRHIPIILLNETNEFLDQVRVRMAGATDSLSKPFAQNELLLVLDQYI